MSIATKRRATSLPLRYFNVRTIFYSFKPPVIESFEVGSQTLSLEMGLDSHSKTSMLCQMNDTQVQSSIMVFQNKERLKLKLLDVRYHETMSGEGRRSRDSTEQETICSRLIDRAIRPLFTAGLPSAIVVTCDLKSNLMHDADLVAITATSAALMVSDIPWAGPLGVARIGRINGNFKVNPTKDEQSLSDFNLLYACTREKTVMIDLEAREISESDLAISLKLAHHEVIKCIETQVKLSKDYGKKKNFARLKALSENLQNTILSTTFSDFRLIFARPTGNKYERATALSGVIRKAWRSEVIRKAWTSEMEDKITLHELSEACYPSKKKALCAVIMSEKYRFDRRSLHEVRPVSCEAGYLEGLHGSSLLSLGETQVLCTVTVAASRFAESSCALVVLPEKRFRVDYDFPSFCTNLLSYKYSSPSRREIGHGMLVEKALFAVFPSEKDFPYIVQLNSKVMSSDGSSSMASVCGGSMALMDAGVPLQCHVAGVSIGLFIDNSTSKGQLEKYCIITDLLGLEDNMGEMDFKIAGTRAGITAIQLDVKPAGISLDIICEALDYGRQARFEILDHMEREINSPKETAHHTSILMYGSCSLIKPMVYLKRKIESETGARLYAGDDRVIIASTDKSIVEKTIKKIHVSSGDAEVGKLYKCTVKSVWEKGAVIEYNGGRHGLLHISELSNEEISNVSDVLSIGEHITLKCIKNSFSGIIEFSLKVVSTEVCFSTEGIH